MPRTAEHTHPIRVRETQLEMHPDLPLGASPLGDDFEGKLEVAQRQLENLQHQREELERQKRELEDLNQRKRTFLASQIEVSERLSAALTMIDRELFEIRQESADLEQTRRCFADHLTRIEKLNPEAWSRTNLAGNLDKAINAIDMADEEYGQAAQHFDGTRSGRIFGRETGKRGPAGRGAVSDFGTMLRNGIAFNLPLFLLGVIAVAFYLIHLFM